MCYSSNNFVVHVCYQRKDKHINIFFCMLHHEDSPEKPQHNMTTSLFLDKLPILPYTLSFLGKIFRPPPPPPHSTPISINFGKADPTMVALAI